MSNEKDPNPNPEVPEKAIRRRFTAAYKLQIVEEADRCKEAGALGELLRREGLYSSHLTCIAHRVWLMVARRRHTGVIASRSPLLSDWPDSAAEIGLRGGICAYR